MTLKSIRIKFNKNYNKQWSDPANYELYINALEESIVSLTTEIAAPNIEYKSATPQCSHFFRGTDGVHACIVEQCNHPDKEKW